MANSTIVKIQDFSEIYTCLLPEEIISIHCTQEQATVYPVVVLRKIDNVLHEDHFTFISDDMKHDIPFVELCNGMIHTTLKLMSISTWILNLMMDVLVNLDAFKQYIALSEETCDAYVSTLKLVMAKINLMAWVVL